MNVSQAHIGNRFLFIRRRGLMDGIHSLSTMRRHIMMSVKYAMRILALSIYNVRHVDLHFILPVIIQI